MAPKSSILLASALALLSASAVMCNQESAKMSARQFSLGGLGGLGGGEGQIQSQQQEEGGLGGLFGGLSGGANAFGLGGLLGAGKEANKLGGAGEGSQLGGGGGESLEKKLAEKDMAKEGGFLGVKGPVELFKLLLNPLDLLGKIAAFFKLEKLGLVEAVGKGVTFGLEVALQPALLSIKIIEKVFVPDACKLKFVCELAKPIQVFKATIPKFSAGFLDGASTVKAFTDGIHGHECEHLYPCGGELKLKKEFELLKSPLGNQLDKVKGGQLNEAFGHGGAEGETFGGDQHYAASNQSPSTVSKDSPLASVGATASTGAAAQ